MAYESDQNDIPLPAGETQNTSSINLLPKYFRTDTNKKFISSTLDQMISQGVVEKLNYFAGRRYTRSTTAVDNFLPDISEERTNYQFESYAVYKDNLDNVEFLKDYRDFTNTIRNNKGSTKESVLNSQEFYVWNPNTDWDKFTNYREYYWLPNGPLAIDISGQTKDIESTYTVKLGNLGQTYVFSPDGVTDNPEIDLYKGQTYRFEINTPGYGFALSGTRSYVTDELNYNVDTSEALLTEGITKFVYNAEGNLEETDANYIENGVIEYTVPETAPDILYYVSESDNIVSGMLRVYDILPTTPINVEKEIIGKKYYTTSDGIQLSNGMKLKFSGNIEPEKYSQNNWYVEGVGTAIKLVSDKQLDIPSIYAPENPIPFDTQGFDEYAFEDAASFPAEKDYFTINRSSADRNPWSRYNRWFHREVIEISAQANNVEAVFDQDNRAKRPIIEFSAGLKLFNHGSKAKEDISLIDDYTTDVFSTIEGSIGYNVDGVDLSDGMRVLFTKDPDPFVNGKIFEVQFITHNNRRQIHLAEVEDSTPLENETVLALMGEKYIGKMFWYDGNTWQAAQDKTSVNQSPKFDLFNKDGISFSDEIYYKSNTFTGTKIFSYQEGNGTNDLELGFPLKYRSISNIGDILFNFNILSDQITFQDDDFTIKTLSADTGFIKKYNETGEDFVYENGWKKANKYSAQAVIRQFNIKTGNEVIAVDVFDNSGSLDDLIIKVYKNGEILNKSEYNIVKKELAEITFTNNLKKDDIIVLKCYSNTAKNNNGFYEIPLNFEKNPLNQNIEEFTLGEVNDHVSSIVEDHPEFDGTYPGISNLRDINNPTIYAKRFVQHTGPLNLPLYHLTDKDSNILKALRYAKNEYSKFKRVFFQLAEESGFNGNIREHVDLILNKIIKNKTTFNPFYFSDMIGLGAFTRTVHEIDFPDATFISLSQEFDLDQLSTKAVNIYLNGEQLTHSVDYVFQGSFINLIIGTNTGDVVEVIEYDSTNGSYIPPTPSKLGLYPAYAPKKYDDSSYIRKTTVLQGHDGSIIRAYNDYRDDLFLELERRIYNNIKVQYDITKLNIDDFVSGYFRDTGITKKELDNILSVDFNKWLDDAGRPNFADNSFFNQNNPFTFNYSSMTDTNNVPLQGYWRNIYKTYFDTDRPHSDPWECLGFYKKPSWWDEVYGPAPYTKNNTVLWKDIEAGIVREPSKEIKILENYKRPGITKFIPVDDLGNLLDPLRSGLARNFNQTEANNNFAFGDQAPVESAWRKSSDFPFALITAWCLLQPAKIFGIGYDISRIERNLADNLVYKPTGKSINLQNLVFPSNTASDNLQLTSGLVNYIANYMQNSVTRKYNEYQERLTNLNNQLGIKLGGFGDKTKLKLVLDSRSPLNKTSVFVPDENYQIVLNTSSAVDIVTFSGIIVEKTENGFVISGYDKITPSFKYYKPIKRQGDTIIKVGGISEDFVDWSERQDYISGQLVRLDGAFYRTTQTHRSTTEFDTNKFTPIKELPVVGGTDAFLRGDFENEVSELVYGTQLDTPQDVVDFLLGYEKYLTSVGFTFDYFNKETESLEDMRLVVQEFLFWITQNWDVGTIITLSPMANQVLFGRSDAVVDDVFDPFYDFNLLTGNGISLNREFTNVFRTSRNEFGLKPIGVDDGIYLVKLPLVQKEHIVLLDNQTVFNDVLYNTAPGYRQERIKVVGFRTVDWNGSLNIPGFVYDQVIVKEWEQYKSYGISDVVKYKEFYYSANETHNSTEYFDTSKWNILTGRPVSQLLPNWDYRTNQFADFYDLDSDNFDSEQQRLAQHLIGYQRREYLSNIITDSVSEYKFYQGFIPEKGSMNSLTKLFDALSSADTDSLEFYEEWALRVGQYGATENRIEIEYELDESKFRLEPQLIDLTSTINTNRTDLVYEIPNYDVYLKPNDYNHAPFTKNDGTRNYTKDVGYVNPALTKLELSELKGIIDEDITELQVGDFVWVEGNTKTPWNVYRLTSTDLEVVEIIEELELLDSDPIDTLGFRIKFNQYPNWSKGDIVGIVSSDRVIVGFFEVQSSKLDTVGFYGELEDFDFETGLSDSTTVGIIEFKERRFDNIIDANINIEKFNQQEKDILWIDKDQNNKWGVFQNTEQWNMQEEILNPTGEGDGFAVSFDSNKSNTILAVGTTSDYYDHDGNVRIYTRNAESLEKDLSQEILPPEYLNSNANFGQSVALTDDGNWLAISAPFASYMKSDYVGSLNISDSYYKGEIIRDRGILWRAEEDIPFWTSITGDLSTIQSSDESFSPVYLLEYNEEGVATDYKNQGIVYLYRKYEDGRYILTHEILSPNPSQEEKFGHKVLLKTDADGNPLLFVGAPGVYNESQGRIYQLDGKDGEWKYSINRLYKGIYSENVRYNENDIVLYGGDFFQANTNLAAGVALPTNTLYWTDIDNDGVEHTGYLPHINQVVYNENEEWETGFDEEVVNVGLNFDTSDYGDLIVFRAQKLLTLANRVFVYKKENDRFRFIQVEDSTDDLEDFGYDSSVSDDGFTIAISAPRNDAVVENGGVVRIYNYNNTKFELAQELRSWHKERGELFGWGIDFDGNRLVVAGKNSSSRYNTTFDKFSTKLEDFVIGTDADGNPVYADWINDPASAEGDETVFDLNTTTFGNSIATYGKISVYENIAGGYLFAEDIKYDRNTKFEDITNFKANGNHIYIGFPELNSLARPEDALTPEYAISEDSSLGILVDVRAPLQSSNWASYAAEDGKIDLTKIDRCFLYSKTTNDLIANIDVIDPRQGKIAGPAEEEIKFKTYYDPAIYSNNEPDTADESVREEIAVDELNNWGKEHVGTVWWDLSNASWNNPYQGSIHYRSSQFLRLSNSGSIDVYEWVESDYLPSDYETLADTPNGFVEGISGIPLYNDDRTYSTARVYDSAAGIFVTKYYFWVKNKKTIPNIPTRNLSVSDIARIIEDPAGAGYRFITLLKDNQFAMYNLKGLITEKDTVLHFSLKKDSKLRTLAHTEYNLLTDGLAYSKPSFDIEQKWIDSLVGYDNADNTVPDLNLPVRQKYGILNFPRQSMFVNRLEALKQFVERVNTVFAQNQLVDNVNLKEFLRKDEAPATISNLYDTAVANLTELDFVGVAKVKPAQLVPVIENGKIVRVTIQDSGNGYKNPPTLKIIDSNGTGAIISTEINSLGQVVDVNIRNNGEAYTKNTSIVTRKFSVLVEQDDAIDNRWSIYEWDEVKNLWNRTSTQSYNTQDYWEYTNWYSSGFNNLTPIDFVVDQSYELFKLEDEIGDIVKINNVGNGGWLLLKKIDDQLTEDYTINYETIGRENGTIKLLETLYSYSYSLSGYDANIYDFTVYDKEPIVELRNIITGIKEDIFVGDLEKEWNDLFFTSVRYVLNEQPYVDWIFKTSFVKAKHNIGPLSQRVSYQNDNLENYQDYVNEVKPFKTKVREYISSYSKLEPTNSLVTDFDLPPSYNENSKEIETSYVKIRGNAIVDTTAKIEQYPFKSWTDNNAYDIVDIAIYDAGEGYLDTPVLTIEDNNGTILRAFISAGKISEIDIVNKGGKYYTAPVINVEGNLSENGRNAKVYAILGNSHVRSTHLVMKFDRVSGNYVVTSINETETFTATGSQNEFDLKWPINLQNTTYSVMINDKPVLKTNYSVSNFVERKDTFDQSRGRLTFESDPNENDIITISYKKDVTLLEAADRINFYYNPTTGMLGKDLAQLMDGVQFDGAKYESLDFGNVQGFDIGGFGSLPWDKYDTNFDDEVFITDDSTITYELSKPLEQDVIYNVYLKRATEEEYVRIDSENWDGSSLDGDAVMYPIAGDGIQSSVTLDPALNIQNGDIVIIRKETSDGSTTPTSQSYDTSLQGGSFAGNATGVRPEDVIVDGYDFVAPEISRGPEELVPGQILDTLDIQVYHRHNDGVGIIGSVDYYIDEDTDVTNFALPDTPHSIDAIFVKLNNEILDEFWYEVDFNNQTLSFADSTSSIGSTLSILTVGTNGNAILDKGTDTYTGNIIETGVRYDSEVTVFVSVKGIVQQVGTDFEIIESPRKNVGISFVNQPQIDDLVIWAVYDSNVQTYSNIVKDTTFAADGDNHYYKFDNGIPKPFNNEPLASNILVKVNDNILRPSYSINYTITEERQYQIETWAFDDYTQITNDEVIILIGNEQIDSTDYTFDPATGIVTLQTETYRTGELLTIYIITEAEYYFVDSLVTVDSTDDMTEILTPGETIELVSTDDSTSIIRLTVKAVTADTITFETYSTLLREAFEREDPSYSIYLSAVDSSLIELTGLKYIISDSLTFAIPPSSGANVEIISFSNHDVNDFNRNTRTVRQSAVSQEQGSANYYNQKLLTSGILLLRNDTAASQYAWVIKNGKLLTPNVDYIVNETLNAVQLTEIPALGDVIDVLAFGNPVVSPQFGYRIFKDILNRTHYKRLNQSNSYVLQADLNYYDNSIVLNTTEGMFKPNTAQNIPGVLWINAERIEYFGINGNTVTQLRRGTLGTGVNTLIESGTRAYGQGPEETITYNDTISSQKIIASGGNNPATTFELDFTPISKDQIEVIVGGRRLSKTEIARHNPDIAQSSPEGDEIVPAQFEVNGNQITFATPPAQGLDETQGIQIHILYKQGNTWNDENTTLLDSENDIARFIRNATITLPK